jgi:hypothetical protein
VIEKYSSDLPFVEKATDKIVMIECSLTGERLLIRLLAETSGGSVCRILTDAYIGRPIRLSPDKYEYFCCYEKRNWRLVEMGSSLETVN